MKPNRYKNRKEGEFSTDQSIQVNSHIVEGSVADLDPNDPGLALSVPKDFLETDVRIITGQTKGKVRRCDGCQ